jgi:hypothetical protein
MRFRHLFHEVPPKMLKNQTNFGISRLEPVENFDDGCTLGVLSLAYGGVPQGQIKNEDGDVVALKSHFIEDAKDTIRLGYIRGTRGRRISALRSARTIAIETRRTTAGYENRLKE